MSSYVPSAKAAYAHFLFEFTGNVREHKINWQWITQKW